MAHGVCHHLKKVPDLTVLGHFSDEDSFLSSAQNESDITIVMDFMGSSMGIQLLDKVFSVAPTAQIILYTSSTSAYIKEIIDKLSNVRMVYKDQNLDNLVTAILTESSPSSTSKSIPENSLSVPKLTPKEKDIVQLLSKGYSSRDMSTITKTSFHTINNQKKHLIAKFQCNNSTEMLYKIVNLGYLPH